MPNKLTDNEIVKALECCYDLESSAICHQCPLYQTEDCRDGYLGMQAYHLINRQKAEIERLKGWQDLLKAEKHTLIKAEAYKEFAEKLKFIMYPSVKLEYKDIDNLLKELVGDDNG